MTRHLSCWLYVIPIQQEVENYENNIRIILNKHIHFSFSENTGHIMISTISCLDII